MPIIPNAQNHVNIHLHLKNISSYHREGVGHPYHIALSIISDMLRDMDREYLCVCNLDERLVPINFTVAYVGTVNMTAAHQREIFKTSILSGAKQIVMLHNHPSGSYTPSKEDIITTQNTIYMGQILNIPLYDHFIVADNGRSFSIKRSFPSFFEGNREYLSARNLDYLSPKSVDLDLVEVKQDRSKILKNDLHPLENQDDIVSYMENILKKEDRESLYALCLDSLGYPTALIRTSKKLGKASARKIIRTAYMSNSVRMVFLRFEPERAVPTSLDDTTLVKMHGICNLSGLEMLDFIDISGSGRYTSYFEKGNQLSVAEKNSVFESIRHNNEKINRKPVKPRRTIALEKA